MFGFSTSKPRPDSEQRYNKEGDWYGEASGPVTEPVDEQHVQYPTVKPKPVAWEAHHVQYQAVAHMPVTHGVESGQYQAITQVPMTHGVYPVQCHAMAQEAQPVQYQLTHGVQSGQYQAVTQVPVAHGTCPVQYHAMAQGAQPMPHQVKTQVPVSQGDQLHYMLVGGQGQLIDPVNQPKLPYIFPPGQSRYVTSTQVDRSGATPHLVSQNAVNATGGVSDNVAALFGQRALPPGQLKSRLQSLPKTLVYDGQGSWQAFLTKLKKFSTIFEWEEREKRDYLWLC
ncbi:hypothetical protein DPMN_187923 [Dreissena polymorpha]|uniref:Uncharacterized protein n=1 Tax=Dreissena polymorpha TaxID=45954 RepID=A0A9D4DQP6_DREPO|nr:hypothetical protein DPMN_187923 [Dreissena polymorpha]